MREPLCRERCAGGMEGGVPRSRQEGTQRHHREARRPSHGEECDSRDGLTQYQNLLLSASEIGHERNGIDKEEAGDAEDTEDHTRLEGG